MVVMRYLPGTLHLGSVCCVNAKDRGSFFQRLRWDADHGNSSDTTKSTAGWACWIIGKNTKVLLDATSKLGRATAVSTPEAELVAGAMAMVKCDMQVNSLLQAVYGRPIFLELGTDNSTARLDILQGYSRGMKHLRHHQRVSIGLLGESVAHPGVQVRKIAFDENTPDVFTKAVSRVKFEKHRAGLTVGRAGPMWHETTCVSWTRM